MEEAHRALRNEGGLDRSRPPSVGGPGLQSITSPMPSPSRTGQVDHIPSLLPLPSDRTFIPSPDQNHDRHMTTPSEHFRLEDENSHHPVARQCCEIMGPSLCRSCRRLESRALNRKSAELECPRMRSAGGRSRQTFSLTQVIKRSYPRLSDAEIQDKLARGEIARMSFPWASRSSQYDEENSFLYRNTNTPSSATTSASEKEQNSFHDSEEEEEGDKDIIHIDPGTYRANTPSSRPTSSSVNCNREETFDKSDPNNDHLVGSTGHRQQLTKASLSTKNAFYFLAKLTMRLRGSTTTPLFFSDLRGMQGKILSGAVDRKAYMTMRPHPAGQRSKIEEPVSRLKSAVSTTSTSSGKSGLSKFGSQLSKEFMPAFVSPRKVKLIEEPKYKVYFEPPLLTKRRQIPNPSFFAGSTDEYSLPERLPDVIEFADSQRIAAMEKQIRSGSALSFVSTMSDEQQQQPTIGQQEALTSLPLGPENESGEKETSGRGSQSGSGRGSGGDKGVSTPTPRSSMRVSSGGPLSARAVPEENEEDVQRERDEAEQNIEKKENDEVQVIDEEHDGSDTTTSNKDQNKLGTIDESGTEMKIDVGGPNIERDSKISKESKKESEANGVGLVDIENQQTEGAMVDNEPTESSTLQEQTSSRAENMDIVGELVDSVEASQTVDNSCSTIFLTNCEETTQDGLCEDASQGLQQREEEQSENEMGCEHKQGAENNEREEPSNGNEIVADGDGDSVCDNEVDSSDEDREN